ncbi:unnamed protein product [Zymoseptoria tritici ST99CH_1A5]|uniref:Outer spore wall protein RRT8 n=1 Tax=Zymoseptoria tritici ST99CH_1A5 TaxID=1276529 RepID=A0A1Y6LZH8_ZYMTR|nr:unnamed protein product [Zymoseptoria tritici ST99CH_1A5]
MSSSNRKNNVAETVKKTAREELNNATEIARSGVMSGTYLYPIKGIFYLLSNRSLWKPLLSKLVPTAGLGLGITTFMFLFTYLPQLAILFFTSGPLATLTTILLVLSESSTLTMVLSKALLIEDSLIDTFDGTLVARGHTGLVEKERQVKYSGFGDSIQRLGKLASKPFQKFTPSAIVRYVMYLPLNFIPVVGTVMFVGLQGRRYGPSAHDRYFQLKGMNTAQKEEFVEKRTGPYTLFGIPAVLLETIPVAGIFFAFTNACGAALWAADLESNGGTAPGLTQQAKKAK